MSLSQNIRYFRLKQNFTQEQLAARIGVSAQAISKWENSETYPDGSLLLPLARELGVSLDTLFDNSSVSMEDLSRKIFALLASADGIPAEHLETVLENLQRLRVIEKKTLALNGESRTVYLSHSSPALLALLLVARQIGYRGAYSYMIEGRSAPFLRT